MNACGERDDGCMDVERDVRIGKLDICMVLSRMVSCACGSSALRGGFEDLELVDI